MQPEPSATDAADLTQRAWRLLAAAAAARRLGRAPPDAGPSGHDADGSWLVAHGPGAPGAGSAAPAEVRPLLDLYAPLCLIPSGRPLTIAHLGQSLDGQIATGSGDSYYVTGPDNLRHLHRLRALCDAVIVGVGTVLRDDPQLTVRRVEGASPVRVILDPRGRLPARHRVFTDAQARTFVVHAPGVGTPAPGNAEVLVVPQQNGRLELRVLLAALHERGLWAVLVEGGGATVSGFLEADLLDRLHIAIAPLVTGSGRPGLTLPARDRIADCLRPRHRVFTMGADVLFDCDLRTAAPAAGESRDGIERAI
jgi:diaminohydroxyphosphoribosylaminopyrimidine deaminase / 5-amino-6-(5-phosphoribosylamino)uracil reductase